MASSGKMSIFAQRMQKKKSEKECTDKTKSATDVNYPSMSKNSFGDQSYVLSGSEANAIHLENAELLAALSQEEILETQERLISELDPALVEYIRQKRRTRTGPLAHMADSSPNSVQKMEEGGSEMEVCEGVKELHHKYPHMDVVEKEKLSWMGELAQAKPPPPNQPFPARFNFEGGLLEFSDSGEGLLRGLHSHGEEQERPGYTVQELLQLCRSSVLKQRVIALDTIANILRNAHMYEQSFSEPLVASLLDAELVLLLRFSLDDEAAPVVMSACRALSNLIVNHIDEVVLDSMLGCPLGLEQPSLGVVLDMKEEEVAELKDPELLRLDIVRGLLRIDLLPRLRYILEFMNPDPVEIKHILKLLVRICRHSYSACQAVVDCHRLLSSVRALVGTCRGNSYFPEALKLFRIIGSRSRRFAILLLEKYNLLNPLFQFISGEVQEQHPELMHLTLESFYCWQLFLSYKLAQDSLSVVGGVVCRLCQAHLSLGCLDGAATADLEHATALLTSVALAAKVSPSSPHLPRLRSLLADSSLMWLTRLSTLSHYSFPVCKLVGAVLRFASLNFSYKELVELDRVVSCLLSTKGMNSSYTSLRKWSWLISGEEGYSAESLPCLGSVPPFATEASTLPLHSSLALYLLSSKNKQLIKSYILNPAMINYLNEVASSETVYKKAHHWHARPEVLFLITITNIYCLIEDESHAELFHSLSFSLVSFVHRGDKHFLPHLFTSAIFNKRFFVKEVECLSERMDLLSIEDDKKVLWSSKKNLINQALTMLGDMEAYYSGELGLMGLVPPSPPATYTGILHSTQPALPADWHFLPILSIYNNERAGDKELTGASFALYWILLVQELKPSASITTCMSTTALYCRLSCVFLAGNSFFRDVSEVMTVLLDYLLENKNSFDFESSVSGLSSFYDFFRELLEQYAAVSYCDETFGRYVLIPLQQRHSARFKKLLWDEMAMCLRLLSVPFCKVDLEDYLHPQETDADLLLLYLNSLALGKVREEWSPVLFRVAVHHVVGYARNYSDRLSNIIKQRIDRLGNQELRELLNCYQP